MIGTDRRAGRFGTIWDTKRLAWAQYNGQSVADGNSLYLVGKVLGHSQAATTQRYAHLQLDPVRAVADRTSHRLADALMGIAHVGR
jgi:hypothetical protein